MTEHYPLFDGIKTEQVAWKDIEGTRGIGSRSFAPFNKKPPGAPQVGHVGSEACRVSIDWLEASIKNHGEVRMHQILKDVLGPAFEHQAWSIHRADKDRYRADGVDGVRIEADKVGSINKSGDAEPWVRVRLPGAVCQAVGTQAIFELLHTLNASRTLKVSRIDIAADDFAYSFLPRDFAEAAAGRDLSDENAELLPGVVTRVRRISWDWKRSKGGCLWIGGKGSPRLLRVYDKGIESKGVIPAVRLELQLRNKPAMSFVADWLAVPDGVADLAYIYAQHLVSFVDFRVSPDTGGRSNSQAWPRQAWWQTWIGAVSKACAYPDFMKPVELWVAANARQSRGFLEVLMQSLGASMNRLDLLKAGDAETCDAIAGALERIRGDVKVELSPHQVARLVQLSEIARP